MAVQAQVWQPFAHPVHRLIQTLDTSVAALWSYGIRVRRLEYRFDGGQPAFANSVIYDQFYDIANGYEKATTELYVRSKAGPMEVARQLENDCISHFTSHGDKTASPAVISACVLVRSVPMYLQKEELQKGYPHSWPSWQLYNDAESIRETIFRHLSRIGQAVPHNIDERLSRKLHHTSFNDEEPPTHDELISWAKETHSPSAIPPALAAQMPPAKLDTPAVNSEMIGPRSTDRKCAEPNPPKLPKVQPSLTNPIVPYVSVDDFSPFNSSKICLLENDDGSPIVAIPIVANLKSTLKALEVHLRGLFAEYKSFELDIETTTFGDVYGERSNRSEPTSVHRKYYLEIERELVLKAHRDRLKQIRGYDSLRTYAMTPSQPHITIRVLRGICKTLADKLGVMLSVVENMDLEEAVVNLTTPPALAAGKPTAEPDAPALNSEQLPVVATPSAIPPAVEAIQPDLYAAVRAFAEKELIGKQSKIIKLLCDKEGRVSLTEMGTVMEWNQPCDGSWNSASIELNKNQKFKKLGWKLSRHNSHAILSQLKSIAQK